MAAFLVILVFILFVFGIISMCIDEANRSDAYRKGKRDGCNCGYDDSRNGRYDESCFESRKMKNMTKEERKDYEDGFRSGYRDQNHI